jgi:hypothetical protein
LSMGMPGISLHMQWPLRFEQRCKTLSEENFYSF